jgi:hypothetical protein
VDTGLERFPPLLLHSLLTSARRFDLELYAHLCRAYNVDADRILGLFSEVEVIGTGPLEGVLASLRPHSAYHDIVFLAGRNALLGQAEAHGTTLTRAGGEARFQALLKQLLPPMLGRGNHTVMARGRVLFVEVRDSVFARGVQHDNPVCGFYSGFLTELAAGCQSRAAAAHEVRCRAENGAHSCMFQVPM